MGPFSTRLGAPDKTVMRRVGSCKRTRLSNDGARNDRTDGAANRSGTRPLAALLKAGDDGCLLSGEADI
jgi:hypothetical protein